MKQYTRSHEPIAWSLFGAGGMVIALFMPAVIVITGLLMPFVFSDPNAVYQGAMAMAQNWIGKLFLLVVIALQLYHTVHRIHHGLHDIHVHGPNGLMLLIFYGGATVLSVLTAGWLLAI
ncbi:fumarate reductase subunit FrdD [Gynuella sunshinyii]|uniref:Fumarate reductase subunit D n=1 Tax=Gynuella sunshinyii YC6258 TaxID=1445510 RepID=A0A0C5VSJ2_9GAMM|nr:fumarate reductase subunit FrdD [Gynuella sunshinyii]AJQ96278.1 fumarate reductase subunit D [Gynuella sunshinyii YC6258]